MTKSFKNIFYVTATAAVFLRVPNTDSFVFYSKHISRTAILTQASVLWPIAANKQKIKITKTKKSKIKNENKKIEKMKKVLFKKKQTHKIIMAYKCQIT